MKISVDDVPLFTLSPTQKQVIKHDIADVDFDADMKRRLEYVLIHKYEQTFKRLKEEWEPKLIAGGAQSLPTDKDAFAQLVFAHPEYKSRSAKNLAQQQVVL